MINTDKTKAILFDYVKSIQTIDPCVPKLAPDLVSEIDEDVWILQSLSGLENMITPEKVYEIVQEFADIKETNISDFDNTVDYTKGQVVKYNDGSNVFYYVCKNSIPAGTPILDRIPSYDSIFWETNLSAFFRNSILAACSYEINMFFSKMQKSNYVPSVMNVQPLHSNYRNSKEVKFKRNELDEYTPTFRGFQFSLAQIPNIQVQLNKIGLQLDTAQNIPFYLYHSSKRSAIAQVNVEIQAQDVGAFVWKPFLDNEGNEVKELLMNYFSDEYNTGGYFWFGFYEDDVLGKMYSYEWYGWRGVPYEPSITYCGDWRYWFTNAVGVTIDEAKADKPNFFELDEAFNPSNRPSLTPFNLKVRAVCNYTQTIENNPRMWGEVVAYYAAEKILRTALNSIRRGDDAVFFQENAQLVIYGSEGGNAKPIAYKRKAAEKALQLSLHELDSVCFKRKGLRKVY